jgi:glycine hydroxymethyltransferase
MSLPQGGHLTHGAAVNFSGKLYEFIPYEIDPDTELVRMEEVRRLAHQHHPKMIVVGYSSYSRLLDWAEFRSIADEVGALLLVDAAHIIGLIAGGAHPDPVPHAHIVTCTTHKALRGPRGGLIMAEEQYGKELDKAVFPNVQGGALFNQIASKAVCFVEASTSEYQAYAHQIVANAKALAQSLVDNGVRIVSGGTDNHLMLADLRSLDEELDGKVAAKLLEDIGIIVNRNSIPFDPRPPYITSGLRLGTPAATTCGMAEEQLTEIGALMADALKGRSDAAVLKEITGKVAEIAATFPPYPEDFPGHV